MMKRKTVHRKKWGREGKGINERKTIRRQIRVERGEGKGKKTRDEEAR